MKQEVKHTASLKGVVGLHWFTVRDDTTLYVHCDDGDFYDRIKIPLEHEQLELMVKSAVMALEGHARKRRLDTCRRNYGSMH